MFLWAIPLVWGFAVSLHCLRWRQFCPVFTMAFLAFSLLRTEEMAGNWHAHSEHSVPGVGGVRTTLPSISYCITWYVSPLHFHTAVFLHLLKRPFAWSLLWAPMNKLKGSVLQHLLYLKTGWVLVSFCLSEETHVIPAFGEALHKCRASGEGPCFVELGLFSKYSAHCLKGQIKMFSIMSGMFHFLR